HRLKDTLQAIREQLGDREAVIARELTKRFEEYVRGSIDDLETWSHTNELKGEFCLVVSGECDNIERQNTLWWSPLTIKDHVEHYVESEDIRTKEAIKRVAEDRQMSSREVYQIYHVKK